MSIFLFLLFGLFIFFYISTTLCDFPAFCVFTISAFSCHDCRILLWTVRSFIFFLFFILIFFFLFYFFLCIIFLFVLMFYIYCLYRVLLSSLLCPRFCYISVEKNIFFGQGTAKTVKVGRIVGVPTTTGAKCVLWDIARAVYQPLL